MSLVFFVFLFFIFLIFIKEPDKATCDYPAGMVLLETCMRYGKISYQPLDVVQWKKSWRPSTQHESDVMERHKQTPKATVRFISDGNAAVRCVVKDVTPVWSRFWYSLRPYLCCIFFICGFWGISRCIRALQPRVCFFLWLNNQKESKKWLKHIQYIMMLKEMYKCFGTGQRNLTFSEKIPLSFSPLFHQ